ncbi:phosphotransferase enzyme family protein [Modestobacter roseus]|nr:phosphotransferase [Modestobacter roseus]MQA34414.1 phosphotransferase [Modestobacter roseus]
MDEQAARRIARAALVRYGLDEVDLHFVKFRENWVFRAECGGESFALRLHRPGLHSVVEIQSELSYLEALQQRGFPVPEPVQTRDGQLICAIDAGDGGTVLVDVLRWVEGAAPLGDAGAAFDGTSPLTPQDFHRVGALAGTLHNHLAELGRLPGFSRAAWDGEGLVGERALWGDPLALPVLSAADRELLAGAIARLATDLTALGDGPDVYGVIHADLTPENILVRGDELVLIDFDDFGEGWHLFELATILFFYRPHPRFPDFVDAVIAGYRTQRPLDDRQVRLWPGMLLARGLTYLGWAAERPGEETSVWLGEHVVPVVLNLARDYLSEHRELV